MKTLVNFFLLSYITLISLGQSGVPNTYPRMAPIESYLITDRNEEIRLSKSAAHEAISGNATVMVLTKTGYEVAITGTNGFVCLVDRSFTGPWDNPEFWNPKHIDPICYNPAAARTVLPQDTLRTNLAWKGYTKEEMRDEVNKAFGLGKLKAPEIGSLAFMLSKYQYLGDEIGPWQPHIMYYVPYGDYFELGAVGEHAPIVPFDGQNEIMTTVLIPVQRWSDGSAVTSGH